MTSIIVNTYRLMHRRPLLMRKRRNSDRLSGNYPAAFLCEAGLAIPADAVLIRETSAISRRL
jgi:hypothetical protein